MKNFVFPPGFEEKFSKILGKEFEKLLNCLKVGPKRAIRVNTLKISVEKLKNRLEKKSWILEKIPWFNEGFFVKTKEKIGESLEHALGYYFCQDGSSFLPPLVLDPKPGEVILDLCSAPGAKTTQMAQMMKNQGIIFANEPKKKRLKALKANLQRCAVANTIITNFDGRLFFKTGLKFKKILIDAPCSGTGTLVSNPKVLNFWSFSFIKKLSHLQKTLLTAALECLKPGGIIVYSTCSLDYEENEEVVDFAVKKLKLKIEKIKIPGLKFHPGLIKCDQKKFPPQMKNCLRVYPFDNFTEGFFIAKLSLR